MNIPDWIEIVAPSEYEPATLSNYLLSDGREKNLKGLKSETIAEKVPNGLLSYLFTDEARGALYNVFHHTLVGYGVAIIHQEDVKFYWIDLYAAPDEWPAPKIVAPTKEALTPQAYDFLFGEREREEEGENAEREKRREELEAAHAEIAGKYPRAAAVLDKYLHPDIPF